MFEYRCYFIFTTSFANCQVLIADFLVLIANRAFHRLLIFTYFILVFQWFYVFSAFRHFTIVNFFLFFRKNAFFVALAGGLGRSPTIPLFAIS